MQVLMLSQSDVQRLLDPDALLNALADEFRALSDGDVTAPRRNELPVADAGILLAMPAYRPGREVTIKLVSLFHGNTALSLPSHNALVTLFDAQTGVPVCIMDGTYITALRTAAAAALSTRLLAREDTPVLAIVGAGVQGHAHLRMLPRVRDFREIRIASHHLTQAEQLAAQNPRAHAVATIEEAVRGADVVCLCTSSAAPVISGDWLIPNAHVTSVGYHPPSGELDRATIERGHLFVETRLAFDPPPAGCGELTGLDPTIGTEIGEVLLGLRPGRQSQTELTVYKAMGHACEDMAAASLVYHRAKQEGAGATISL